MLGVLITAYKRYSKECSLYVREVSFKLEGLRPQIFLACRFNLVDLCSGVKRWISFIVLFELVITASAMFIVLIL